LLDHRIGGELGELTHRHPIGDPLAQIAISQFFPRISGRERYLGAIIPGRPCQAGDRAALN
jgi:hypothetical protein